MRRFFSSNAGSLLSFHVLTLWKLTSDSSSITRSHSRLIDSTIPLLTASFSRRLRLHCWKGRPRSFGLLVASETSSCFCSGVNFLFPPGFHWGLSISNPSLSNHSISVLTYSGVRRTMSLILWGVKPCALERMTWALFISMGSLPCRTILLSLLPSSFVIDRTWITMSGVRPAPWS